MAKKCDLNILLSIKTHEQCSNGCVKSVNPFKIEIENDNKQALFK